MGPKWGRGSLGRHGLKTILELQILTLLASSELGSFDLCASPPFYANSNKSNGTSEIWNRAQLNLLLKLMISDICYSNWLLEQFLCPHHRDQWFNLIAQQENRWIECRKQRSLLLRWAPDRKGSASAGRFYAWPKVQLYTLRPGHWKIPCVFHNYPENTWVSQEIYEHSNKWDKIISEKEQQILVCTGRLFNKALVRF